MTVVIETEFLTAKQIKELIDDVHRLCLQNNWTWPAMVFENTTIILWSIYPSMDGKDDVDRIYKNHFKQLEVVQDNLDRKTKRFLNAPHPDNS